MRFIKQLILSLLLLSIFNSAYSQSTTDWIVKLSEKGFTEVTKHPFKDASIQVISSEFKLVALTASEKKSKNAISASLSNFDIVDIFPNLPVTTRDKKPDDFLYDEQWSMDILGLPQVWEHTTGGTTNNGDEIVVAILDDGYQFDHEDIQPNIWLNENEIANDDIDNDNNGVKDDFRGYNVDTMNDDLPISSHGTKVFGIIAGKGNNGLGISGVNWNVKVLPIGGINNVGEIMMAMQYIIDMKRLFLNTNGEKGANVMVSNLSSGVDRVFPEAFPDWCTIYDTAGELGILSISAVPNTEYNVDIEGDLPTVCPSEFLLTVTNTNRDDIKYDGSGFGKINVDVGAPGVMVTSTTVGSNYTDMFLGTSCSAPHVTGAAALLFSSKCSKLGDLIINDPPSAAKLIKECIINGVEQKPSLSETSSGGRINVYNSFLQLANYCSDEDRSTLEITDVYNSFNDLKVQYSTNNYTEHTFSLFDSVGELISTDTFIPSVFGEQVIEQDVSRFSLTSGYYVATISNDNEKESKLFFYSSN